MAAKQQRFTFQGANGEELSARLDLPAGPIRGYALFAHCFTCSKDVLAARRIAQGLAGEGLAVVRFDFTGLGSSSGDFANTNFSSNVEDLLAAVAHMRATLAAPKILIGHSLGGAAVLAAAPDIEEVAAVVTVGAPADVDHVLHNLGTSLDDVKTQGEAQVTLGGRPFTMKRQFVEDALGYKLEERIKALRKPLLVLHAPLDDVVSIDNASKIFTQAKHPKSFISLDDADHLLSRPEDGAYAASIISAWASKYIPTHAPTADGNPAEAVIAAETGLGKFQNTITIGAHHLLADEPKSVGGLDTGPGPYDFVSAALAACTSMTLRIYAEHKKVDLGRIEVEVRHGKVPADHCTDCGEVAEGRSGKIDRFERIIRVEGDVPSQTRDKIAEIADKCPVHKTLEAGAAVATKVDTSEAG